MKVNNDMLETIEKIREVLEDTEYSIDKIKCKEWNYFGDRRIKLTLK